MSTVPLGCEYRCSEQSAALCRADVSITFSENGNNEIAFQADEINAGTKTCDTSFSVTQQFGLGTPLKVPMSIYPKDDGKYDGTEKVDVQFELITDNSMWNEITFDLQVSSRVFRYQLMYHTTSHIYVPKKIPSNILRTYFPCIYYLFIYLQIYIQGT